MLTNWHSLMRGDTPFPKPHDAVQVKAAETSRYGLPTKLVSFSEQMTQTIRNFSLYIVWYAISSLETPSHLGI